MVYTTIDRQPRLSASASWVYPLTRGSCIPSCSWPIWRKHGRTLVSSCGFTKPLTRPWRWGWNQSLKCWRTFTSWHGWEHFIEYCHHKSFKNEIVNVFICNSFCELFYDISNLDCWVQGCVACFSCGPLQHKWHGKGPQSFPI